MRPNQTVARIGVDKSASFYKSSPPERKTGCSVALAAAAVWFHLWEPFHRASVFGLVAEGLTEQILDRRGQFSFQLACLETRSNSIRSPPDLSEICVQPVTQTGSADRKLRCSLKTTRGRIFEMEEAPGRSVFIQQCQRGACLSSLADFQCGG